MDEHPLSTIAPGVGHHFRQVTAASPNIRPGDRVATEISTYGNGVTLDPYGMYIAEIPVMHPRSHTPYDRDTAFFQGDAFLVVEPVHGESYWYRVGGAWMFQPLFPGNQIEAMLHQADMMINAYLGGQEIPTKVFALVHDMIVNNLITYAPDPFTAEMKAVLTDAMPNSAFVVEHGNPVNTLPKNWMKQLNYTLEGIFTDNNIGHDWSHGNSELVYTSKHHNVSLIVDKQGKYTLVDLDTNTHLYEGPSKYAARLAFAEFKDMKLQATMAKEEAILKAEEEAQTKEAKRRNYYKKHFGFDPVADLQELRVKGVFRTQYDHFWTPMHDPFLVSQGLEIGARVYKVEDKIYNRMVFRLGGVPTFEEKIVAGDSREQYFTYKATQYLQTTTFLAEEVVQILLAQFPDITPAQAISAVHHANKSPRYHYTAPSTLKVKVEKEPIEKSVTCIHTAVYDTTLEGMSYDLKDDTELARTAYREYDGEQKEVPLVMEEHFAALKMYVGGIVDMGLQNVFVVSYQSEEINPTTMPFGFNGMMQQQILQSLKGLLGDIKMEGWVVDFGAEIIDGLPLAWLESRWKKLWFKDYTSIQTIILDKYPNFIPLLRQRLRKELKRVKLDDLDIVEIKQILALLGDL